MKGPIGVFDSGFGGLTVLKDIVRELPEYDYMYLGDSARAPYGPHSSDVVYQFTEQGVDFLFKKGCKLIVIACNTASSEALRKIQQEYLPKHYPGRKVLGVLIPAAEEAVLATKNNKIGVIGTDGTINSGSFVSELKKLNSHVEVFQKACPLLGPIVEVGEHNLPSTKEILKNYLEPLKNENIDTLILGCTHYGPLAKSISQIVGGGVALISCGLVTAIKLKEYLSRHDDINKNLSKNGSRIFYTTDLTEKFEKLGGEFFGNEIEPIKVSIQ